MNAVVINAYGHAEDVVSIANIPEPKPGPNQLKIKVKAASINPVDWKIIAGNFKLVQSLKFPVVVGYDFAGEVVELGSGIETYAVGNQVFGCLSNKNMGSMAEYIVCFEHEVCEVPVNVSLIECAALPMVGMTSLQCFNAVGLNKGDRILIFAGSGGVGSTAIQLANAIGAQVFTTTSSLNADWVHKLGAEVIEYDTEDYTALCKNLDVVLDTLGGENSMTAISVLREGGKLVNIAGGIDHKAAKRLGVPWIFRVLIQLMKLKLKYALKKKSISYYYVLMDPSHEDLSVLKKEVEKGLLKPVIEKVYSMEEVDKAFARLRSGRVRGKLVIQIS